jgi:hypothetical protein
MVFHSQLIFDARKIYLFSVLIALLYGLSPVMSAWLFDSKTPLLIEYQLYFSICASLFLIVSYPFNRRFKSKIDINESRLKIGMVLTAISFILTQITLYGDFTTAFIIAYTERTGVELSGGIRYIFYPVTIAFISMVLLLSTHLYLRRDRINFINLTILTSSILIFSALGSRNLLLWSFSAVLGLFISKLRYRYIFLLVIAMYLVAVVFAYGRNNGLIAYWTGAIDQLYGQLTWDYFDPMIHEFGSSYRTFVTVNSAEQELQNAPYSQLSSFILNQLPSFMKPSNFISFTDYISLKFAEPGEGIGSSPMTEAYLSSMLSLVSLTVVLTVVYWPAYYFRRWPSLSFFTYALAVAVCFNVWRIGSAEILKMFASSAVALFVLAKVCGFRVLSFRTSN